MSPVTPEPTPGPQGCTSNTPADPQAGWVPDLAEGTFSQNLPPPQPLDPGSSRIPSPILSQTHRGPKGLGTAGPGFCSDLHSSGPKGQTGDQGLTHWQATVETIIDCTEQKS